MMTDRERFENNAKQNGATIIEATKNILLWVATNGTRYTRCEFDDNGKFINFNSYGATTKV